MKLKGGAIRHNRMRVVVSIFRDESRWALTFVKDASSLSSSRDAKEGRRCVQWAKLASRSQVVSLYIWIVKVSKYICSLIIVTLSCYFKCLSVVKSLSRAGTSIVARVRGRTFSEAGESNGHFLNWSNSSKTVVFSAFPILAPSFNLRSGIVTLCSK